jgi:hypothetical protein
VLVWYQLILTPAGTGIFSILILGWYMARICLVYRLLWDWYTSSPYQLVVVLSWDQT